MKTLFFRQLIFFLGRKKIAFSSSVPFVFSFSRFSCSGLYKGIDFWNLYFRKSAPTTTTALFSLSIFLLVPSKMTFSLRGCWKNEKSHSHPAWRSFFFLILVQRGKLVLHSFNTSAARVTCFSLFSLSVRPSASRELREMFSLHPKPCHKSCRRVLCDPRFQARESTFVAS